MALHPEAQRKAQAQLDEVVGKDRLPDYEDINSLPYIQAVLKELLRWQPVTPLGMWHRSQYISA
jgi:cytochrome P450